MTNLQVFKNSEFGDVRVSIVDNTPYFCLTDVCRVLDIKNPRDCKNRLNQDGVGNADIIDTLGRTQQATFINESNLYKVIFQSRKPEAERFTEWVASEVLPSIRKNGMYVKEELLDNPDLLLDVVSKLKVEREEKLAAQKQLAYQAPKVAAYNAMLDSKNAMYIREVAKLLNSPEWGEKRLFRFLKNAGVLMQNNEPYQKYIDKGYFRVVIRTYKVYDETRSSKTTLVLPKGIDYILKLIRG